MERVSSDEGGEEMYITPQGLVTGAAVLAAALALLGYYNKA